MSKTTGFVLHPRLQHNTLPIADFPLSNLLLLNDRRFPWFLLVPRREAISEIYQLTEEEQAQLWQESARLGKFLMETFCGDKLNIAALGNLVPQLHLHHVVRYRDDEAWPGPVWGVGTARPYDAQALDEIRQRCCSLGLS